MRAMNWANGFIGVVNFFRWVKKGAVSWPALEWTVFIPEDWHSDWSGELARDDKGHNQDRQYDPRGVNILARHDANPFDPCSAARPPLNFYANTSQHGGCRVDLSGCGAGAK